MVHKGILSRNYYIVPEAVADYGAEIYNVMAEADQAMEEASEVIAEIASLTERVPSQIRYGALLEACESAQAEIRSVDFLSYGQRVNQGLQNLLDHNQYITEQFIKNMGAHTEKMRGLGEEFRRFADSITYSGESVQPKGIVSSAVSNAETENTDDTEENSSNQGQDGLFLRAGAAEVLEDVTLGPVELGQVILRRYLYNLKDDNNINVYGKDEIDKICNIISNNNPQMYQNLYITSRYSSYTARDVINAIMDYYNTYTYGGEKPDTPLYNTTEERISNITDFNHDFDDDVRGFLDAFERNKETYAIISERTNMPIEVIAIIHYRENTADYIDGDFNVYLRDGKILPTSTTEDEGEILHSQFINEAEAVLNEFERFRIKYHLYPESDDIIGMLCFMEVYNGVVDSDDYLSPYIYSGTDIYESGKYTKDNDYDPDTVDKQVGAYRLLLALRGQTNYAE